MSGHLLRRGEWWSQGEGGSWFRWDPVRQNWEPRADPPPPPLPHEVDVPQETYRSPRRLGTALVWLFVLTVAVDIGTVAAANAERVMLSRAEQRGFFLEADTTFMTIEYGLIALIGLPLVLATMVVFIIWFHRLYRNLKAIGAPHLRYGTGWAIGGWFVPFLSLWRPKQIINDIWRVTDPELPIERHVAGWRDRPVPGLLLAWWLLFLFSSFADELDLSFSSGANTIPDLMTSNGVTIAAAVMDGVAAVTAALMVRRVTARQETRAAQFQGPQVHGEARAMTA